MGVAQNLVSLVLISMKTAKNTQISAGKKPVNQETYRTYPLARHWDLNPVTLAKGLKIGNLVSLCLGSIAVLKTQCFSSKVLLANSELSYSLHHCGHMNNLTQFSCRCVDVCLFAGRGDASLPEASWSIFQDVCLAKPFKGGQTTAA